jgi:hypothetical protein
MLSDLPSSGRHFFSKPLPDSVPARIVKIKPDRQRANNALKKIGDDLRFFEFSA